MKIAIVGCGIGGLTAANFLADAGNDVTIFDQFSKASAVGSGLVIQPVGMEVLKQLGVAEEAVNLGARGYQMLGFETDSGHKVLDVSYGEIDGPDFGLGIHRATLFDLLLKAVQQRGIKIEHACKVISSTITDGIRFINLDRGMQIGPFDLVVDASGAQSLISPLRTSELAFGAIWGTVDWPEKTELKYNQLEQRYRKASNMIGVLPIGFLPGETKRKAALFWSLPKQDYTLWCSNPIEEWQNKAELLWPELAPFIQQITNHEQMTMARYSHGQLYKPYADGLVFIGDSAHRASPQLGQGANMALLDAYALARSLNQNSLNQALKKYACARRNHVMIYQALSWTFTPMYQSKSKILPIIRDRLLGPMSTMPPVSNLLTSLVKGTMINPTRGL